MSNLQQLIDDLTNESAPLSQSLRQLLAFSYRADSDALRAWVLSELDGYPKGAEVPSYRKNVSYHVRMFYSGYGGYQKQTILHPFDLPTILSLGNDDLTTVSNSISELEAMVNADTEPFIELPKRWVEKHAQLFEEGEASGYSMMVLDRATIQYSRLQFVNVLSTTRTEALKLALELEKISPEMLSPKVTTADELQRGRNKSEVLVQQFMGNVTIMQSGSNTMFNGGLSDHRKELTQINLNEDESRNAQQ